MFLTLLLLGQLLLPDFNMRTLFFLKKYCLLWGSFVFLISVSFFPSFSHASTNISTTDGEYWGWNDVVGWIRFNTAGGGLSVTVTNTLVQGYATSTAGDISLDCGTTSVGSICGGSVDYKVTNDGSGNLSGYAWNDVYGWISFDCHNTNACAQSSYQVTIDSNGDFSNYAWNDVIGWISFNCVNTLGCGSSSYKVKTSWAPSATIATLDSSIFDTGVSAGAQLHSLVWRGSKPAGTSVQFQIAASNDSSGPWTYIGPDGTSSSYYPQDTSLGAGVSIPLDYSFHNNYRYFRYRVRLSSNSNSSAAPRIDDIIINWTP